MVGIIAGRGFERDRRQSNTTSVWTAYDGSDPYADFDAAGTLAARYLRADAGRLDLLLARFDGAGAVAWYLTDDEGSVREVVAPDGSLLDRITYGPYGEIVAETNPAAGDRFKYAGGSYDDATGLTQFGLRWYDPVQGRWLSQDPGGYAMGDSNLYRYAANDPMNNVDPSGLSWLATGGSGGTFTNQNTIYRGGASENTFAAGAAGAGESLWYGLGNVLTPFRNTAWDLVALPIDLVGTAVSTRWTPQSYAGTASQEALDAGVSADKIQNEMAKNLVLNGVTVGAYGYGAGALEYAQTGDPTQFQQGAGGFLLSAAMLKGMEAKGLIQSPALQTPKWGVTSGTAVALAEGPRVVKPATARIGEVNRGRYGHQLVERIAGEAEGALSQANRILESGGGKTTWARRYQRLRGTGGVGELLARRNALHQEAEAIMQRSFYVLEAQSRGVLIDFNMGSRLGIRNSRGNLVRPDIQLRMPTGKFAIIDWTTEGKSGKIFKYGSPNLAPWMINVTLE